jgi:hypothetical protein
MRWFAGLIVAAAATLLGIPGVSSGLETDQFSVPEGALADIGPEVDLHVEVVLREIIIDANAKGIKGTTGGELDAANDLFAKQIDDEFCSGIPECTIESWVRHGDFRVKPARYEVPVGKSVYGHGIGRPITMFDLAPTVNLYGHYIGTDKVGHFFQQGYEYYKVYRDAREGGSDADGAVRAAVKKGVSQEAGIYGIFIIDTYSNADLASNLAGLMWYRSLTRPVKLGDTTIPAMLIYRNGRWDLNARTGDRRLRPFVTDHWDEAINPSYYVGMLRHIVEGNVKEMGAKWVKFHRTTREKEIARLEEMKRWYDVDYGHAGGKSLVTIVNGYFDQQQPRAVAQGH